MISFLINALKIIFTLGFLVLIHELGHFLVAKACKVRVNEFSIGFGPTLLKKQGKQTKYSLRLIPIGGYVAMEGEDRDSDKEDSFGKASIPKRMAIVVAGGIVNIVFAMLVYFVLTTSVGNNISNIVSTVIPDYAASEVGIQQNDEIVAINGKKIHLKQDVTKILEQTEGKELTLTVKREGKEEEILLTPTKMEYKNTGIYLKGSGETTKILTLQANSSGEKAGLEANDEILKINEVEVKNQQEIVNLINTLEEEKLAFTIKRGNEEMKIEVIPETQANYYLGVNFKIAENSIGNNMYYAFYETGNFVFSIFDNLKLLFTGNVRLDQMMGPVGISEVVAGTNGVADFVSMLALISLSLGITNLLPFPALDGGKLVLLIIEAIRRKKLSEKVEMNIQLIGFAILISLSIYIAYHDVLRLF